MSVPANLYRGVFKRTSTFFLTMVVGAFFVESGIDRAAEYIFNEKNKGKLWHHIKDNYKQPEE